MRKIGGEVGYRGREKGLVHKAKGKPRSINRSTGVDRDEQEIRIES